MTHSNSRLIALCGLIIVDIFMIFVSFYLAAGWVFNNFVKGSFTGLLIIQCVIILTVYLFGGYALRRQLSYWHIPGQMAIAIVLALIIIATVGFITKLTETDLNYWRTQLLTGMLFSYVWLSISRFVVRFLLQKLTEEPSWMIVGSKDQIDVLQKDMHATYGEGRYIIHSKLEKISDEELYEVDYDGMILMPEVITKGSEGRLLDMRFKGKRVFHVSEFYERYLFKVPLNFLDRTWFATSAEYGLINQEVP